MACKNKIFYTNTAEDHISLSNLITLAYWIEFNRSKEKNVEFSTLKFYENVVTLLKSEDSPFKTEYPSGSNASVRKMYKESFIALKQDIVSLVPDWTRKSIKVKTTDTKGNKVTERRPLVKMSEFVELIDSKLLEDLGAGKLKIKEDENESHLIGDDEEITFTSYRKFIKDVYKGCYGAVKSLENTFKRELFLSSLIDFKRGILVTSNSTLNDCIANYKDSLFKKVVSYLKSQIPDNSYDTEMYSDDGNLSQSYFIAMMDMRNLILKESDKHDVVTDEHSKRIFGGNSSLLNAIDAYVSLKYFDDMLNEFLGKSIKVMKNYKNQELPLNYLKYSFSTDTSHQRKSWNDSDQKTAIENSSKLLKFVLESIPLKIAGRSTQSVGVVRFTATITKLFRGIPGLMSSANTETKKLLILLESFHDDPVFTAFKIFKTISEDIVVRNDLKALLGFTADDFGVVDSVLEFVLDFNEDMDRKRYDDLTKKSIKAVEYNTLKTSYNLVANSIVDEIIAYMNDCMQAAAIQTTYGPDGGFTIKQREIYRDKRGSLKFIANVNGTTINRDLSTRIKLAKLMLVTLTTPTSLTEATIKIPMKIYDQNGDYTTKNFVFDMKYDTKGYGIIAATTNIEISDNEKSAFTLNDILDLFSEGSEVDISTIESRHKLIDNLSEDRWKYLNAKEQLFIQILKIIDDRLQTQFLTEDGLRTLQIFSDISGNKITSGAASTNVILDLIKYAVKALVVSDIYKDFNDALNPLNTEKYDSSLKSKGDFLKFLKHKFLAFNNLSKEEEKIYFRVNEGIYQLLAIPSSTQWAEVYDLAKLITRGENISSTSKNLDKKNEANYVTSFLGGQIYNLGYNINKYQKAIEKMQGVGSKIPNSAASSLLFARKLGAINGVVINSDILNRNRSVKSIRSLNASEAFYNAIVHNFWGSFLSTGEYCVLPTTYSDKVKLIQYLIKGDTVMFNGKQLQNLTKEELIEAYQETVGKACVNAAENIKWTYSQLWDEENLTLNDINKRLKTLTESELIKQATAKGIDLILDFHYRVKGGKCAINEVVAYNQRYNDIETLRKRFNEEEINFVNNLVDSGINFYVDYADSTIYDRQHGGVTITLKLQNSSNPVAKIILNYYETDVERTKYFNDWVKNGKLILAKDKNGNPVLNKNVKEISELNPLLEKFFYTEALLSTNLRLLLTGFETNHPDKSKFIKMWGNLVKGLNLQRNLLLYNANPTIGKGKVDANITRLQEAKVIWGHPRLGKTTYLESNPNAFLEWDAYFNEKRNRFIAEKTGKEDTATKLEYLRQATAYFQGDKNYKYTPAWYNTFEEFRNLIDLNWLATLNEAKQSGKKLFASPLMLLSLYGNDFDLILTTDKDSFLDRFTEEEKENAKSWKESIDNFLNNEYLIKKTVNVGNLYMSDIMALNDNIDLFELLQSENPDVKSLAEKIVTIIENISQSTLLKRNVIIPANLHYVNKNLRDGPAAKIKVAFILDIQSLVFNFTGDRDHTDSMDGSALTTALLSRLENGALKSLKVGVDKKPIWYYYDAASGTSGLMKFASFEINNERILASLAESNDVQLLNIYKKMTNLQWKSKTGKWKTSTPFKLGETVKVAGRKNTVKLDFQNDIMLGKSLYYKSYDENGEVCYKQIIDFGGDDVTGYYTVEKYVNEYGYDDLLHDEGEHRVYHYYSDESSEHITVRDPETPSVPENYHTINSLYELWLAMGGAYTLDNIDEEMIPSESSQDAVVAFMINTVVPKTTGFDKYDISQHSYAQPLKEMQIGYLCNNSAMKNGVKNRNSVEKWKNNEAFTFTEIDSSGLGIQMDADHDVELAATMTEFSLVISALTSQGKMHKYSGLTYSGLERLARASSKLELETVAKFIAGINEAKLNKKLDDKDRLKLYNEVKNILYDLVANTLINGAKTRDDSSSLTQSILRLVESKLGVNLDHYTDKVKIPFSDPNVYSLILETLVPVINAKSIKRKYPGSGCVMVPAYNIMQYFQLDGKRYMFADVVELAREWTSENNIKLPETGDATTFERQLVTTYLQARQEQMEKKSTNDGFIPTDIVDIIINGKVHTVDLNDLDTYYAFKDLYKLEGYLNKVLLDEKDVKDIKRILKNTHLIKTDSEIDDVFGEIASSINTTGVGILYRYNVIKPKNLAPVKITFRRKDNGKLMNVFDLAPFRECYEHQSRLNRKAVQKAFDDLNKGYFIEVDEAGNENKVYISDLNNSASEMIISNMYRNEFGVGNKSIAQIRSEGLDAFKVEYTSARYSSNYDIEFMTTSGLNTYISFTPPPLDNRRQNHIEKFKKTNMNVVKDPDGHLEVYLTTDDNRRRFKIGRYLVKEGYSYKDGEWIDEENKVITNKKVTDNLKNENGVVYEYVPFITKYNVIELTTNEDGNVVNQTLFDKYHIDIKNIARALGYDYAKLKRDYHENGNMIPIQLRHFITNIIDGIYSDEQYLGINVNPQLSRKAAVDVIQYVANMRNLDTNFRKTVMLPLENFLANLLRNDKTAETIDTTSFVSPLYEKYFDLIAKERMASWELSLYFTAARIPAQTLQSFMQMEAIAYSGNSRNIVYVSHWQAWLQGSDYDIDKAYIMGLEFGNDGRLVKFSNLFDYSNLKTLQASLWLPIPRSELMVTNNNELKGFDVTEQLNALKDYVDLNIPNDETNTLNKVSIENKPEYLKKLADLIIDINNYSDRNQTTIVNLNYSGIDDDIVKYIVRDIYVHNRTKLSPAIEEKAYKNSISGNIKNIVQALPNMALAYSPITMDDLRDIAEESEKGAMIASMSMLNPLTKYTMLIQNMAGKTVIGIAAVGEKVFFNLTHYYNEGIRSKDEKYLRNLQFALTFDRIQGRYNYNKTSEGLSSITKTQLANINFEGNEEIRQRFLTISQIDTLLRNKYNITDDDINNQTEKWDKYQQELNNLTAALRSKEVNNDLNALHNKLNDCDPVDLMISLLLSAATDNAKELILDKINCGANLAKCHLYLLMLGFDIKDVVSFMTSPAVYLVNDLSNVNMMDSYVNELRMDEAVKLARGKVRADKFFLGSTLGEDEYGSSISIPRIKSVFASLSNGNNSLVDLVTSYILKTDPEFKGFKNLNSFVEAYIQVRTSGHDLRPLSEGTNSTEYETRKGLNNLSDYVETLIYRITKAKQRYSNSDDFEKDLTEFEKVFALANETSTLGSTFLGMNQGLPTTKLDLQKKILKITKSVSDREKALFTVTATYESGDNKVSKTSTHTIEKASFFDFTVKLEPKESEDSDEILIEPKSVYQRAKPLSEKEKEARVAVYGALRQKLIENNPFVEPYVDKVLQQAIAFDILGNFNVEDWLYDKQLTREDIVRKDFLGNPVDMDYIMDGKESISYREMMSDYYNIIKGTWNIFDVVNKVPQYKSIIDLLKTEYVVDKYSSIKSQLMNKIYLDAFNRTNYLEDKDTRTILKYVNDLLIIAFFRTNAYSFPIPKGTPYLDAYYNDKEAKGFYNIDLNNAPGRASFKKAFENVMVKLRDNGTYLGVEVPNYKLNKFLLDLHIVWDSDGSPMLTLGIDLNKIGSTQNTEHTFQQYLDGFKLLSEIKVVREGASEEEKKNALSFGDYILLYNLFVNLNLYGSDRLTSVFREINPGGILDKYYNFISSKDYELVSKKVLDDIEYNIEDLLIRMAPYVSRAASEEGRYISPYIKTRNKKGETIYKKWDSYSRRYSEISTFPDKDLTSLDDSKITEEQKANYHDHLRIPMKNLDFNISLREGLMSKDRDMLANTLYIYSKRGILQILHENCP